mgnify:FL=1|tara:strand:+ start:1122 stop:1709 length:588 start_codon:yes stop_codon:yes gene_type:complete
MTTISPLKTILKKGLFGDHEGKNEAKLIEIKEITKLLIVQIAQYKNSSFQIENLNIDGLNLPNDALKVISNSDSRILWCGPKNWLLVSKKKDLLQILNKSFNENDFAVTDLSHSRAIIEIEGENSIEILKKGCPFNFNELKKDNCVNSVFNGLAITIDIINDNPYKIRLFTLRSFGESFYHSVSDACLEDGFKVV